MYSRENLPNTIFIDDGKPEFRMPIWGWFIMLIAAVILYKVLFT